MAPSRCSTAGRKTPRRGCRKAAAETPRGAQEARRGFQGGPRPRASRTGSVPVLGLPKRRPRTRHTPRSAPVAAREERRVGEDGSASGNADGGAGHRVDAASGDLGGWVQIARAAAAYDKTIDIPPRALANGAYEHRRRHTGVPGQTDARALEATRPAATTSTCPQAGRCGSTATGCSRPTASPTRPTARSTPTSPTPSWSPTR